jgi:hypothetical protein
LHSRSSHLAQRRPQIFKALMIGWILFHALESIAGDDPTTGGSESEYCRHDDDDCARRE